MKFRITPVLALLLPFVAMADSPPKASMQLKLKPYALQMRDFSFPSGLRIVFQQDNSQPIVNVSSVIDHGSADEPPGLEGMAHLIEHLNFRAKHKDAQGKELPPIWDIIGQIGARSFNATTSNDRTNYLTTVPKENLVPLLRIESLRLINAVEGVTDDVIRTEREVVRNELRASMENGAWGKGVEYLFGALYPKGHPYSRETIGTHDSLNNITLKDVQEFCAKYYRPSETTILVSGDIDLDKATTYLKEFGIDQLAAPDDPKGERLAMVEPKVRVSGPAPEPPDPASPVEVKGEITAVPEVQNMVEKPLVIIGWALPAGWRPNEPLMQLVALQAGIAIQQELNPAWVYSKRDSSKITDAGCEVVPGKYASTMICYFEISDAKDGPKKIETALNGLHNIWTTDESFRTFQTWLYSYAKYQTMMGLFQSVDSLTDVFGRGNQVSEFIHQTGDVAYYSRSFEWLNAVNPDDARKFAEKYMKRERAVAVVVKPYEEGQADIESKSAAYAGTRGEDKAKSIFTDDQLTSDNVMKAARIPDLSKLSETTLGNGMKVVVMPHGSAPLVEARVYYGGGYASSNLDYRELVFATELWKQESTVDPLRIAGYTSFDAGSTWFAQVGRASSANISDLLYVLRNEVDGILPYTDGKLDWAKTSKKDILTWMKEPDAWAGVLVEERLFPGHRATRWLNHADYDEMVKWGLGTGQKVFSTIMRPENATLFVVGNVEPGEVQKAAQTYFGGWAGWGKKPDGWTKPVTTLEPNPAPPARQILLLDKEDASQAHVVAQCQLPTLDAKDYQTSQVMADYLDAILWLALREQTGASYGAGAGVIANPGGYSALYQGVSTLQNNQIALAMKSFTAPLEEMRNGKIDERTWKVMRMNYAQASPLRHATGTAMLGRLRQYDFWGWGIKDLANEPSRIANADYKDVPRLLEPCVGHEVVTIVGAADVYKPLLDAAGWKYEVFDWKQARKDYRVKHGMAKDVEKEEKAEAKEKDKKK